MISSKSIKTQSEKPKSLALESTAKLGSGGSNDPTKIRSYMHGDILGVLQNNSDNINKNTALVSKTISTYDKKFNKMER